MLRASQLALCYRSLAQLLGAGVPVLRAVDSVAQNLHLSRYIASGSTLAEALARSGAFPAHHLKLIAIAETSGRTEAVLIELADFTEQLQAMRRTILAGLILPALILHAAAFVIPLPSFLLGGSWTGYLMSSLGFLAIVWLVIGIGVVFFRTAPAGLRDALLRPLPLIGRTWRELDYWRVVSSMEMLTNAGLGVIEALHICADTCRSPRTATALREAADAAQSRGDSVSATLAATREFPDEMVAMWSTGEQSGKLDEMFVRLARQFADRCQRRMQILAIAIPWVVYALVSAYLVAQIFRLAFSYINTLNSI